MVGSVRSLYLDRPVGVPQGSILGPILFSFYIKVKKGVNAQLYADDTVIFTPTINTTEAGQILTTAMAHVQDWLTDSCLSLNVKKSICMIFAKRPPNIEHSGVFLGGEELTLLSEFRYLGVTLGSTLSFRKHIKKLSNSVQYNLANFRQIRNSLTSSAALMFLQCMIFSHIDYCL